MFSPSFGSVFVVLIAILTTVCGQQQNLRMWTDSTGQCKIDAKRIESVVGTDTPPQITNFRPAKAASGKKVTLNGRGFTGTTAVIFTAGRVHQFAKFTAVSDKRLEVEVPPLYTQTTPAVISVFKPSGVAVTLPRDAVTVNSNHTADQNPAKIHVVARGGILDGHPQGTVLINTGGVVKRASALVNASLTFVKEGGRLIDGGAFVVHEPNAHVPAADEKSRQLIEVPTINVTRVRNLFTISETRAKSTRAKSPPVITGINATEFFVGEELTLSGSGFFGTLSVKVKPVVSHGGHYEAPFHVVSDTELKVVVPFSQLHEPRPLLIAVHTQRGVTLLAPKDVSYVKGSNDPVNSSVRVIQEGGSDTNRGHTATMIEKGGFATGNGNFWFVKKGGTLMEFHDSGIGRIPVVYYEPGATVEQKSRRPQYHQVPSVTLSQVESLPSVKPQRLFDRLLE